MNRHRRRTWGWFLLNAVVLLGVMAWLTAMLTSLDRDELAARQQAQLQEKLRLSLWRMDSWLSPQLALEAMRPPSDYRAFAPAATAWTAEFDKLPPDQVLMPSPLLGFRSELFRLHFELDRGGALSSPQVPTGNERDVAENSGVAGAVIERAAAELAALQPRLQLHGLDRSLGAAEALLPVVGCVTIPAGVGADAAKSVQEYGNRQLANVQNQGQLRAPSPPWSAGGTASIGPMLPFWLEGSGEPMLILARRVRDAGGLRLQGVVVDWQALSRSMLALVSDLFAGGNAALVRCEQPTPDQQGCMLATVPARLRAQPPAAPLTNALPTVTILIITWGATLLALGVLGFTLRRAIGYGERRARFASAVTHELRTPLTTFRMYSEMLADGVITEPTAQRHYLATLRQESDRLARVVENVLAWSRLEEGRFASRRERHQVASLLQRAAPPLQRRLADAGMTLRLDVDADAHDAVVTTDEDAVAQILFNLVDNAAKYAAAASVAEVEIRASKDGDRLRLLVRDHGPGIPAAHRARIFAPFDRGAVPAASNDIPGVGLGLALARGLAHDLGGELALEPGTGDGAGFVLTLPLA